MLSLRQAVVCADESYQSFHDKTPWKSVGGGEAGSCVTDRGFFAANPEGGHVGPYNPPGGARPNRRTSGNLFECVEKAWRFVAEQEYVWGNFVWTVSPHTYTALLGSRLRL